MPVGYNSLPQTTPLGQSGDMSRWVCWHPKLGFLRFIRRSQASCGVVPDPRGCFTRQCDAASRQAYPFWVGGTVYQGTSIIVAKVNFSWVVDEP